MTSRERVYKAFNHEQPDRTPVFEYVLLSPIADTILKRPYEDFGGDFWRFVEKASENGFEKSIRQYAKDRIDLALKLGHDMIYCVPCPTAKTVENFKAKKKEIALEKEKLDPYLDPVKIVAGNNKRLKEILKQENGDSHYYIYFCLKEEMNKRSVDLPIYAPAFSHGIWTNVELMQTMLLDEAVAKEHFSLQTEKCIKIADKLIEYGADIIGIGGDFAGNRPLISTECYHQFIMPELKKCSDYIHHKNKLVVNASDGNLWSVIDDFLIGSGTDAYGEIDEKAGMDLPTLKERYGDKITFLGNIDCGLVLSYETPEGIKKQTIKCIEDGFGGGHILTASNAISASVPLENYLAMVNGYRAYFNLAPITLG